MAFRCSNPLLVMGVEMTASAKSDTPRTDDASEGSGWVTVFFARQLERELTAALADPVLRGEIENAAYERAAEICDTWSGYKTYQGDAQGACDDCAAAIRALKK
jgi:hypothetical protein